ncbi:MAG: YqzL family protein [Bacillota bacterium]|nr:YqzL family protein [Bacillota bacterium]
MFWKLFEGTGSIVAYLLYRVMSESPEERYS